MRRVSRLVIVSVALVALVSQGTTAAAASRVRSPIYQHQNSCGNPDTSASRIGFFRFSRDGNSVTALAVLRGAQPNTSYLAALYSATTSCSLLRNGLFTTDGRGNGRITLSPATVSSGEINFYGEIRLDGTGAFVGQTVIVELQP